MLQTLHVKTKNAQMVCMGGVGRSMTCLSQYRNLDLCVTKYEEGVGFRYAEIYELDFCKMAGLT